MQISYKSHTLGKNAVVHAALNYQNEILFSRIGQLFK